MDWKRNGLRPFIEPSIHSLIASTTGQQQPFGRLNKKSYIQSQIMGPHKFLLTASSLQLVRWTALFPLRAGRCRESDTLGAAQVALKSQACIIGERPILFGTGPLLYLVAYQYVRAGAKVQAILDTSPWWGQIRSLPHLLAGGITFAKGLYYLSYLRARGVLLQTGVAPVEFRAAKSGNVGSFVWADSKSRRHETKCDSAAFGFNLVAQTQIADLCGLDFEFNELHRQWLPKRDSYGRSSVQGIYLAGDGVAINGADVAEVEGRRAARALLSDIGFKVEGVAKSEVRLAQQRAKFRGVLDGQTFPFPSKLVVTVADEVVFCRCEGISAGSLREAITKRGATDINQLKAFTRLGMGRCQGRLCATNGAEILAAACKVSIEQVGRLRGQAPVKPISIGELAGAAA